MAMEQASEPGSRIGQALRAIAGVVGLEAVRGRMPWLMLAVLAVGVGIAEFTAEVAITESREIARGVLGAWLRVAVVFITALFVITSMTRDWTDKGVEMVLALALPRAVYLAGRLLGYSLVALACAAACTILIAGYVPVSTALVWGTTLGGELLVIAAMALLCMLTFNHVPLAMCVVMSFYLLARAMDAIVLISANPLSGSGTAHALMVMTLDALAFVLPDLDRFARAEWLIHGGVAVADVGFALGQTAVYLVLLSGAALFDLQRKIL